MRDIEGTVSYLRTAVRKTITAVAFFAAVFLIAGFMLGGPAKVYAADTEPSDKVLTVTKDGEPVAELTLEDLQQIAAEEGNKSYSFSSWNTYPSFSRTNDVHGPTVEGILEYALNIPETDDISDVVTEKATVQFVASDGYSSKLTGKQLFGETRYYYPNGDIVRLEEGMLPEEDAYQDAEPVKAVISTESKDNYKLFVGQVAPNEENNPVFVKGMAPEGTPEGASGGTINISTETAPRCSPVSADPSSGTLVRNGSEITITSSNNADYDKVYFTLDSDSSPGYGSSIYNYGPKQGLDYKPVISGAGDPVVLKVVVKGYGKQDSTVQRFTYYTGDMLTVKINGVVAKAYSTAEDLDALSEAGPLTFSGFNSFPNLSTKTVQSAKRVDDIIEDATGRDVMSFGSNSLVKFTGVDNYSAVFTIGQLFGEERYYYPDAAKGTDQKGGKASAAAYAGKIPVPAVIEMAGDNTMRFGQTAPNEQNFPECVNYMLTNGVIEITTDEEAKPCSPVTAATPASGSVIESGTKIELPELSSADKRNKVYYIVDPQEGEIPGAGCDFYHYSPYNWPEKLFNQPVIEGAGKHILAVKVSAYGKQDSEVTYFEYTVKEPAPDQPDEKDDQVTPSGSDAEPSDVAPSDVEPSDADSGVKPPDSSSGGAEQITAPGVPQGFKAAATSYNTVKLSWNKQTGIKGYRLYRAVGSGSFKLYRSFGADAVSYTNKSLKTGTKYSYRLTAFVNDPAGTAVESKSTSTVSAKPALKKPSIKLKAGKRKATVKWKKISGANGYVIYRSAKKSSGYKKVKTITKGKTVKFTDKKLKKGKKYYYKIRAYRKVKGKKVYSKYSAVKTIRAK